jgi:hypothetical protein
MGPAAALAATSVEATERLDACKRLDENTGGRNVRRACAEGDVPTDDELLLLLGGCA